MAMDFLPTAYIRCLNGIVDLSTALTAVRCGSSNLEGRKWLVITNASNVPIFFGSSYLVSGIPTTITAAILGKLGTKMAAGDSVWLPVGDTITIYARANSGAGKRLRIMELG